MLAMLLCWGREETTQEFSKRHDVSLSVVLSSFARQHIKDTDRKFWYEATILIQYRQQYTVVRGIDTKTLGLCKPQTGTTWYLYNVVGENKW